MSAMSAVSRIVLSSSCLISLSVFALAQSTADPLELQEAQALSQPAGFGAGFVTAPGESQSRFEASLLDDAGALQYVIEGRLNAFDRDFSTRIQLGSVSGYLYDQSAIGVPLEFMRPVGMISGVWSMNGDGSGQLEALMVGRDPATGQAAAIGYMSGQFDGARADAMGGHITANASPYSPSSDDSSGPLVFPPPPSAGADSAPGDVPDGPIVDPGPWTPSGPVVTWQAAGSRASVSPEPAPGEQLASRSAVTAEAAAEPRADAGSQQIGVSQETLAGSVPYGDDQHWGPVPYGDDQHWTGPGVEVTPAGSSYESASPTELGDFSSRVQDVSEAPVAISAIQLSWGLIQ